MPEPKVSQRLGEVLESIYVPKEIAQAIVSSLESDRTGAEALRQQDLAATKQRLPALRTRMDQMYEDKLDGRIDEGFWTRKMNEWREQERCLEARVEQLSSPLNPQRALTVQRVLELANKAYSLYLTRNPAEQGQLLRMVLLNCATDSVDVWPTYRKPFDLIFQRAQREEWSGRADLNCRPLAPQASALPGCATSRRESHR